MSVSAEKQVIKALRQLRTVTDMQTIRSRCQRLAAELDAGDDFVAMELVQIQRTRTTERAHYYIDRLIKALTEAKPAPNSDLDLRRWKQYADLNTDSLWRIPARDRSGVHSAEYWGNFVPQIPNQLMRRFTRQGDWVLDPFAGSGTTLIECLRLGRNGLGIELQKKRVVATRKLLAKEMNPADVQVSLEQGDSRRFDVAGQLKRLGVAAVQLAILHPPYHDIIRFSDAPEDLSNQASAAAFVAGVSEVAARCVAVLQPGRHLALVIGDKYEGGEWVPLGFLAMQVLQNLGLTLKSIIVKDFEKTAGKRGQEELWRYRALAGGFYVFKHEYIFLFQKP